MKVFGRLADKLTNVYTKVRHGAYFILNVERAPDAHCMKTLLDMELSIGREKLNFCAVRYTMRGLFLSWS